MCALSCGGVVLVGFVLCVLGIEIEIDVGATLLIQLRLRRWKLVLDPFGSTNQ